MNKNDFIGVLIYLIITIFFGYKISFLTLFIKENSDRCLITMVNGTRKT